MLELASRTYAFAALLQLLREPPPEASPAPTCHAPRWVCCQLPAAAGPHPPKKTPPPPPPPPPRRPGYPNPAAQVPRPGGQVPDQADQGPADQHGGKWRGASLAGAPSARPAPRVACRPGRAAPARHARIVPPPHAPLPNQGVDLAALLLNLHDFFLFLGVDGEAGQACAPLCPCEGIARWCCGPCRLQG